METADMLTEHGLLEVTGPDRYPLHQSINAYARLAGNLGEAQDRLASYYTQYVGRYTQDYAAVEREFENIRAALKAAEKAERHDLLWVLLDARFSFLDDEGFYDLAGTYLARLEQTGTQCDPAFELYSGRIVYRKGDTAKAQAHWETGLALAREGADHERAIVLLSNLSSLTSQQRDYETAKTYLEEAAAHAHAVENCAELARARQSRPARVYAGFVLLATENQADG